MHHRVTTALVALAAALTCDVAAASPRAALGDGWTLNLDGQYRPRVLFDTGYDFRDDDSTARGHVTHRARLGLTMQRPSGLAVVFRVQDVRIWGEETSTLDDSSADGLDAHEAYLAFPLAERLELRVGRQQIAFDEQRLVGSEDWTQRSRAFDAVRLSRRQGRTTLDAFYAKVREDGTDPDGHRSVVVTEERDFGGLHATLALGRGHQLAYMYLLDVRSSRNGLGRDEVRHTPGAVLKGKLARIAYTAEGYLQYGNRDDDEGRARRVQAFLGAVRASYGLEMKPRPTATLWAEVVSGRGKPQEAFDTLYASNHGFYGQMDVFDDIPRDTANLGLVDLGGRLAAQITEKLVASFDLHHLRTMHPDKQRERTFGNEFDLAVEYAVMDHVGVSAFYGWLRPRHSMRSALGYSPDVDLTCDSRAYVTLDAHF